MKKICLAVSSLVLLLAMGCNQQRLSPSTSAINGSEAVTPSQMVLTWNAARGEQTAFTVQVSTDGKTFTTYQTVPDGTNSVSLAGLTAGSTYYFRINSYNAFGTSPYSPVITVAIPAS